MKSRPRAPRSARIDRADPQPGAAASRDPSSSRSNQAMQRILGHSGQPLEAQTRSHFEQRLGVGLSGVRLHTGQHAHEAAGLLQTPAFAVGRNLVFGPGQYAPHTPQGYEVLSHELVHAAQQRNARGEMPSGMTERGSFAEREASSIATTLAHGGRARPTALGDTPQIARLEPPPPMRPPMRPPPPNIMEQSPTLRNMPRQQAPGGPTAGRGESPTALGPGTSPTYITNPHELWEWEEVFRNPPPGSQAYQDSRDEAVRMAEIPRCSMALQGAAPDFVWNQGPREIASQKFWFTAQTNFFSVPNALEHDASQLTSESELSALMFDYLYDLFPDWQPSPGLAMWSGTTLARMRQKHFGFRYNPEVIDPDGSGRFQALLRGVRKAAEAKPALEALPLFKTLLVKKKPKKAAPKTDPQPKPKPEEKKAKQEQDALETAPSEDTEKPGKPLMWRTPVNYKETTSTGGLAGGLDFRFPKDKVFSVQIQIPDIDTKYSLTVDKSKRMPWHAHHTWPKFVGGAPDQSLMSVRDMVHISVIHPALYAYFAFLGHSITNTETGNKAFIDKLKSDAAFRKEVKRQLTWFYIRVNTITDPQMPAAAYEKGINDSLAKLGG